MDNSLSSRLTCSRGLGLGASSASPLDLLSTSLLTLLSSGLVSETSATLWTNMSVIQSYNWFFQLTKFEAMFFGMFLMHFVILNAVGILPLRINSIFNGGHPNPGFVRRKRRSPEADSVTMNKVITPILRLLEKADQEKCFQRTLCEIQHKMTYDQNEYVPSPDVKLVMKGLQSTLAFKPKSLTVQEFTRVANAIKDFEPIFDSLTVFQEAIETGMQKVELDYQSLTNSTSGSTPCQIKYHECGLATEEIFSYLDILDKFWYTK